MYVCVCVFKCVYTSVCMNVYVSEGGRGMGFWKATSYKYQELY